MAEPKQVSFLFLNGQLICKVNPTLLQNGQLRRCLNMETVQEGSLSSRMGRKYLGASSAGSGLSVMMIRKLGIRPMQEDPDDIGKDHDDNSLAQWRYVGFDNGTIYLTSNYSTFTLLISGISTNIVDARWSLIAYPPVKLGMPLALFAGEDKMCKTMPQQTTGLTPEPVYDWGITPAFGTATAVAGGGGTNLNSSDPGQAPYDWRYCYVSKLTGTEGNPSQTMLTSSEVSNGVPLVVTNSSVVVTVWGTDDTQVDEIAIYRRGGILYDTWRFVGFASNPGFGRSVDFTDNTADADLVYAKILEVDNDPPVVSRLPLPGKDTLIAGHASGFATLEVATDIFANVKAGSLLHIYGDKPEDVTIAYVYPEGNRVDAWLQRTHADNDWVEVNASTGKPCYLSAIIMDTVILAGDSLNPDILYMSKNGNPEVFPVIPADGTIRQLRVGSVSNPIVNLTEFRGLIVTLNRNGIYEVIVQNGSMYGPYDTGAKRGLVATAAWCKVAENEIWYLATDGVWSWDGGGSRKRTEGLDQLFRGQTVNGLYPVSMAPDDITWACMEYHRGQIRLLYYDTEGITRILVCEPEFGDRWRQEDPNAFSSGLPLDTTFLYHEEDIGRLIYARQGASGPAFSVGDSVYHDNSDPQTNYTSDEYTSDPRTSGHYITFEALLPWFDLGTPNVKKLFEEVWLDVDPQRWPGVGNIQVEVRLDYSEAPVDVIDIAIPAGDSSMYGRQLVSLLPREHQQRWIESVGREARAISFRICGYAYPIPVVFYSLLFQYQETGLLTAGGVSDWSDLGYKHDKKLYQLTIQFDTEGTDRTLFLDTMTGRAGNTYTEQAQTIVLSNPVILGAGRAQKTVPILAANNSPIIAKLVRVRPASTLPIGSINTAATDFFRIHKLDFEREDFPPDIVAMTPWTDGGYAYDKYCQQVDLEVNTNNVTVTVTVQADGVDKATFTVTSTESDRRRNITLPANLSGKKWRLFVDPNQAALTTGAGMFQLFTMDGLFRFQPADKGEVGHSFDYDDLGYPYDKALHSVLIEWDNTAGADVTFQMDTLGGISGQVASPNVAQFLLSGGRSRKVFALPADLVAKMVRIYPTTALPTTFKSWKYLVEKEEYPPDVVTFTPDDDGGYAFDKYLNQVTLEVDTNNQSVAVIVQADGSDKFTFNVQTTARDRRRNITAPPGLMGRKWRLYINPAQTPISSGAGKFQLFSKQGIFRFQQADKGEVFHTGDWDDLGYPHDKKLYTISVEWDNTAGADVTLQMDTLSGISGGTQTLDVQEFALTGGRSKRTWPITADTIVKMVRVYPKGTPPTTLKEWHYTFEKEDYPPDVVSITPMDDGGYPYEKYAQQCDLDVDTGGATVSVAVQADGVTVNTFTVNTTYKDRKRNITLPPNLSGKQWRLYIDPTQGAIASGTGKFQLFANKGLFRFQKVDLGEVVHTQGWDDLGYVWDKALHSVLLRWDNTGGNAVTLQLDTLGGIDGQVLTSNVAQFVLTGGRSQKLFPLPADVVCKCIRLYPTTTPLPTGFKTWSYVFEKEDFPPDVTTFTPWDDGGIQTDKYLNQVDLEVDTNNVAVTVTVQADGATATTLTVTATNTDRRRNITMPANLIGKQWRLYVNPNQTAILSGGGKFQLFGTKGIFKFQPADLGDVVHSQDWNMLGHPYDKALHTITVFWDNTGGAPVTLQLDTLSGINGHDVARDVTEFVLSGNRSQKCFPLPADIICKAVKVYPKTTPPTSFRQWSYQCEQENYPADITTFTPWDDGGYPYDKYLNQVDLEVDTAGQTITVAVQADGTTQFTFTVSTTYADRRRNITAPPNLRGKKWRIYVDPTQTAIANGTGKFQLFGHAGIFRFQPADKGEVFHTGDYDDLGYPYDKKLYTVSMEWDNTGNSDVTLQMDTLSGIGGATATSAVQTFTLTGGRSKKTWPIVADTVVKMVRVYPTAAPATNLKEWKYLFEKEDFPPDTISITPWEDGGYEYDKYLNQIDLDVDTANQVITVIAQADGVDKFTFTVQSTYADRRRNITTPTGLMGKKWRLYIDPTQTAIANGTGKFQLFTKQGLFRFQQADKGEVGHTFDWDDLGHPWDKYLRSITVEWDNTSGSDVTLQLDTLTGINGQTLNSAVSTFTLSGGRSKCEFPLPKDTVAKMIRLYPIGTPAVSFRQWKYFFDKIDYPCDLLSATEWKDAATNSDKNPSWLHIDADTNSVAATVNLENENGTVLTVNHTGSQTNRKDTYAIPVDTYAKMWRLSDTPGNNGRFQLFAWGFERWQPTDLASPVDPVPVLWVPWNNWGWPYPKVARNLVLTIDTGGVDCTVSLESSEDGVVQTFTANTTYTTRRVVLSCNAELIGTLWRLRFSPEAKVWDWLLDTVKEPPGVTQWHSMAQALGYKGWKALKQLFLEYRCASTVTVAITSDTGAYSVTLPAHSGRSVERVLLPSVFGVGLNKSLTYQFDLSSASECYIYADASGIDFIAYGSDRRTAYSQMLFSEFMQIPIGAGA